MFESPAAIMRLRFLIPFSAMSLLSLLGCSFSTKDLPARLEDLRVSIEAEHITDSQRHSHQCIRAVLSNAKGAAVERADVKVEVNGLPMRFRVHRGNYYDRHPSYVLDESDRFEISPATDLKFVLVLPDESRHDIGTLRTPAALSPRQFDFAQKAPASGPVVISWRDLAEPVQLQLGRSEQRQEADNHYVIEGTGPHDPDALRRTIGPGWLRRRSDHWAVPASFLVSTPNRKLLSLHAEIVAVREGRVSAALSKRSSLRATRRIQLEMEFAPVN